MEKERKAACRLCETNSALSCWQRRGWLGEPMGGWLQVKRRGKRPCSSITANPAEGTRAPRAMCQGYSSSRGSREGNETQSDQRKRGRPGSVCKHAVSCHLSCTHKSSPRSMGKQDSTLWQLGFYYTHTCVSINQLINQSINHR